MLVFELGTHIDCNGRGKVVRGLAGKMRQAVVVVRSKVAVAARSNEAASRMQAAKPRQLAVAYQGNSTTTIAPFFPLAMTRAASTTH